MNWWNHSWKLWGGPDLGDYNGYWWCLCRRPNLELCSQRFVYSIHIFWPFVTMMSRSRFLNDTWHEHWHVPWATARPWEAHLQVTQAFLTLSTWTQKLDLQFANFWVTLAPGAVTDVQCPGLWWMCTTLKWPCVHQTRSPRTAFLMPCVCKNFYSKFIRTFMWTFYLTSISISMLMSSVFESLRCFLMAGHLQSH